MRMAKLTAAIQFALGAQTEYASGWGIGAEWHVTNWVRAGHEFLRMLDDERALQ
jgi:hypothetical protein